MKPSFLTLQVANGRNPLKMIEGELSKMSRGGFLRGLVGALGAPSTVAGAVVKAAVPAVAQAVVQHVAKPAEDPKVAQHKIDHGHVVKMFRKFHDSVGNKDIHRDSDVQHYAPMNAWTDAGESVAYKHKSGKFVRYDDNVMSGYGPSGRVTYNVHTYDPKSGELTHHSPQIDTRSAPDTDDYEGAEGQVAAHNWQKSQINKHLDKLEGLEHYHQSIAPHIAKQGYHELSPEHIDKQIMDYRQGPSSHGYSVTPHERSVYYSSMGAEHLEGHRIYGSFNRRPGDLDLRDEGYHTEPHDPPYMVVTGLDKKTGKPGFLHKGPDFSELNTNIDNPDPQALINHVKNYHEGRRSEQPASSKTPDQEHNEWFSSHGFKKQGKSSDTSYYVHPQHGGVSVDWHNPSEPYIHHKSDKSFSSLDDLSKHLSRF